MARSNNNVHEDYTFTGSEMGSPVASLSGVIRSGVDYGKPWIITPTLIVNFVSGLVISSAVTAVAILANIVGYGLYCLTRQSDADFKDFSRVHSIPVVGSLVFGVLSFMVLMSTSLIENAINDNFCARLFLRLLLLFNVVMYMTLSLVEDFFVGNDNDTGLVAPGVWSGVLGLSFVMFFGACFYVSGIESYIAKVCANLYQNLFYKVDSCIGETTEFYRLGGLQGRVKSCLGRVKSSWEQWSQASEASSVSTVNPLVNDDTVGELESGQEARSPSTSQGKGWLSPKGSR